MDVKKWVKDAREHAGLSQQKLGDAVLRSKANVGHWETGKHEPSISQVEHISWLTKFPVPQIGVPSEALQLRQLILSLAAALKPLTTEGQKAVAASVLSGLAREPEQAEQWASLLENLLGEALPKSTKP